MPHTAQKLHKYLGYDGHLFSTQHVVEYQEETCSHQALTYDHTDAIGTWTPSALPLGHTSLAPLAGAAAAGAAPFQGTTLPVRVRQQPGQRTIDEAEKV